MGTSSMRWDPKEDENKRLAQAVEKARLEQALAAARGGGGSYYHNSPNSRDVSAGRQQMPPRSQMPSGSPAAPVDRAAEQADADRRLAAQLAERAREQQQASQNRRDESSNLSNLEEQRKRDAAARALALFQATGPAGNALGVGAARGQLT